MNPFTIMNQMKVKETYDSDGTATPPLSPVINLDNSYARFDTTNEDDSNYRSNPSEHANSQSRIVPSLSQSSQQEILSQTQSNTQYIRSQIPTTLFTTNNKQLQETQEAKKKEVAQSTKQNDQQLTSSQQHNRIINILSKVTRSKKIADQNWSVITRDEIKIIWKMQRQRASKISNYPSNEKMITEIRIKMRSGFYDGYLKEVHQIAAQQQANAKTDKYDLAIKDIPVTATTIASPIETLIDTELVPSNIRKWVQCTDCSKWRKVPESVNISSLSVDWTCSQNTWCPSLSNCSANEEGILSPLAKTYFEPEIAVEQTRPEKIDNHVSTTVGNPELPMCEVTVPPVEKFVLSEAIPTRLDQSLNQLIEQCEHGIKLCEQRSEKIIVAEDTNRCLPKSTFFAVAPLTSSSWKCIDHSLSNLLNGNSTDVETKEVYKWKNGSVVLDTNWRDCEDNELIRRLERNSSSFIFNELLKALNVCSNFKSLTIREPNVRSSLKAYFDLDSDAIKKLTNHARSLIHSEASTQTNSPPTMNNAKTQTAIPKLKDSDTQTFESLQVKVSIKSVDASVQRSPLVVQPMVTQTTPALVQVPYQVDSKIATPTEKFVRTDVSHHSRQVSSNKFVALDMIAEDSSPVKQNTICKCKATTKCLRFYCPCFKAGRLCTSSCCCSDCDNNDNASKSLPEEQLARTDLSTPNRVNILHDDMSFSSQIFIPHLPMYDPRKAPLSTIVASLSDDDVNENSQSPSSTPKSSFSRDSGHSIHKSKKRERNNSDNDNDKFREVTSSSKLASSTSKRGRESDNIVDIIATKKVSRFLSALAIDMITTPNAGNLVYSRRQAVEKRCDQCNSFQRDCPCDRNDLIEKEKKRVKLSKCLLSENSLLLEKIKKEAPVAAATTHSNPTELQTKSKMIKFINLQSEKLYVILAPSLKKGKEVGVIQSFCDRVDPYIKQILCLGDTLVSINNEKLEDKNISFNQQIELIKNGARPCLLGFAEKD